MSRKPVFICSPYAGDVKKNSQYAWACMRHSLDSGEAPVAVHLLYPKLLRDENPGEREQGMECGVMIMMALGASGMVACYCDLGVSDGMMSELRHASAEGLKTTFRKIGGEW